ncbi:hypothetical protein RDI58_007197 [Solanum bulbocastanum]|uniref:Ulp1 protease family, C-terminal catalytic domain containing protein n=1 Tax=Solanum bulbocastanum TaxID=147425 RepID=A0AAN8TW16_SOLBU
MFKFTNLCCNLYIVIQSVWDAYDETDCASSKEGLEEMIIDYINKQKMHAYAPWHTIDNVFILVNVKERDCGVYIAAYTKFLSGEKHIPETINPEEVHIRYASLLWNYDIQNLQAGAVSDDEAPLKLVRNHTESDSSERITIQ